MGGGEGGEGGGKGGFGGFHIIAHHISWKLFFKSSSGGDDLNVITHSEKG